jgi:hypothetical protein
VTTGGQFSREDRFSPFFFPLPIITQGNLPTLYLVCLSWLSFSLPLQLPVPFRVNDLLFFQIIYLLTTEMNQTTYRAGQIHLIVDSPLLQFVGCHVSNKPAGTTGCLDPYLIGSALLLITHPVFLPV